MNVTEEGIFIDHSELMDIEKEVKTGGRLYQAIRRAKTVREADETVLPNGQTVRKFNQQKNVILLKEIKDSFEKGLSFPYTDGRSTEKGDSYFINANPDGSEDLMLMHIVDNKRTFEKIQQVTPAGQGKYFLEVKFKCSIEVKHLFV